MVFIETSDQGHGGEYGVVYSEKRQTPVLNDNGGIDWTIDQKINDNWWNISYRLE